MCFSLVNLLFVAFITRTIFKGSSEDLCGGALDSVTANQLKAFLSGMQWQCCVCKTQALDGATATASLHIACEASVK